MLNDACDPCKLTVQKYDYIVTSIHQRQSNQPLHFLYI